MSSTNAHIASLTKKVELLVSQTQRSKVVIVSSICENCEANHAQENCLLLVSPKEQRLRKKSNGEDIHVITTKSGYNCRDNYGKICLKRISKTQFEKFLDDLKKLYFNNSFIYMILQISRYKKFLKEMLTKKRMLPKFEVVALTEESSARLKLELGEVKAAFIMLQHADRKISCLLRKVEDVLMKAGDLIFSVNFVMLDMEEDWDIPIILG
ncbi:uncharacterized protein LOC111385967 [Olea europaea var. sylvestris]|uniref:uncharacterized protein LOC111385967 n=1 Tax=Olea europaea var. sylvestris TaxID=158386 RepID=UPI000C1CE512|nr:uncharacterized protein LOC111385967 [Olea europaea var. sylvestris]